MEKNNNAKITIPSTLHEKPSDRCWRTGYFTDDCFCEFCDHRHECSGYDHDDD